MGLPLCGHACPLGAEVVKPCLNLADTEYMIISDDQARRAVEYIRSPDAPADRCASREASTDLTLRVRTSIDAMPSVRSDRVRQARDDLASGRIGARDVADKMIARALSDSIR